MRRRAAALLASLVALLTLLPTVALATNDPFRDQQWGLDLIRAEQAWSASRGAGTIVAVIDTGVDLEHPDLRSRLVRDAAGKVVGLDLVDGDDVPQDQHGHGTLVAGVIAASAGNGEGIAGVAPDASILPIRVLDGNGAGRSEDVGRAIRWAVDRGAHVINLSLEAAAGADGQRTGPGVPGSAVRYAWERGVVVIAAAGNQAGAAAAYPSNSPVLLVGAVDRDDQLASFSHVGREDAILAPGVEIVSTWCRSPGARACDGTPSYGVAEGTSFAAPHVSGVAALLVAQGLDNQAVVDRLRETAVDLGEPGPDPETGVGRVDAAAAVGARPAARTTAAPKRAAATPKIERSPAPPAEPSPAPEPSPSPSPEPSEPAPEPDPEPQVEVTPLEEEPAPEPEPSPVIVTDDEPLALPIEDDPVEVTLTPVDAVAPFGPSSDGATPLGRLLWQFAAAALVGGSMAAWSSVVRAER